ncbi:Lissencephaly-1-like protein [Morus notabilis]|uniref:Lissencephaly-1-like protein n=1 Tax=Morus notabilis TaxID=981085 RepID=W9RIE3_9ROSA|nr:protein JINGUBANG [Morus notabilis]EXB93370.1 Lissencephaly-1-like protein [Morus notabilis]
MELYHQNSLLSIIYEERSSTHASLDQTPTHNFNHDEIYDAEFQEYLELGQFSPPVPASPAQPRMLPPPSPESPWTCSPLQTPSPSLLYHCIASLHRHDGTIHSIAVSNGVVFTGSDSRRIRAWRQPDCTERGLLKAKFGEVRAILAHGDTLFTCHKDNKIRVWNFNNFASFKKVCSFPRTSSLSFSTLFSRAKNDAKRNHKECVSCLAYYHAEGILYTGSHDRTVKAWRVSSGKCVDSFLAHEDKVNDILVNQEDGCVFTCSSDGSVKIWRRIYRDNSYTLTMILRFQPSPVNAIALSLSSSSSSSTSSSSTSSPFTFGSGFLYSGSSDGTINFWERERTSYRFNHGGFLQGHRFSVLCLVAVEKMVFSGSEDTTIRIWRREEGSCLHECLAVLDGHRGPVKCLAACLEVEKVVMMGFLVYSASLDQTFKVWRVKVLPDEETTSDRIMVCAYYDFERNDSRKTAASATAGMEYETMTGTSPVLSPSWVEIKKRQLGQHYFQ